MSSELGDPAVDARARVSAGLQLLADRLSAGPSVAERRELGGDGLRDIGTAGHNRVERTPDLVAFAREPHALLLSLPRAGHLCRDLGRRPLGCGARAAQALSRCPGALRRRSERVL